MHVEVFVDVIFAENFVADLSAIWLSQELLYRRKGWLRSFLGAFIGACIAVLRIVMKVPNPGFIWMIYIVSNIFMVWVSFGKYRHIALQICVVHAWILMMGAIAFVLKRMLEWYQMRLSSLGFCGYILAFYVIGSIGIRWYQVQVYQKSRKLYEVCVEFGEKKIYTKALLDTGNQLKEPHTGKPVSILESRVCMQEGRLRIPEDEYCCIPYHSVGKEAGILHGIHVTKLVIKTDGRAIEYKDAIVAIYQGRLSQDSSFGMILQPELMR